MRSISVCPCCGGARSRAYPAVEAAFVADYALGRPPQRTRLLECSDCGFRFFESRYEAAEVARLYSHYRGDAYFEARHRREFWYTRKINDAIGADAGEIAFRKQRLLDFLKPHLDPAGVDRVLDYGGDQGQFLPEGLGRSRFVYEISGLKAVPGVTMLADASALTGQRFDLVLCAHVLEHLSEPESVLQEIAAVCAKDAWLVIELPWERYGIGFVWDQGPLAPFYKAYLAFLTRHPRLFSLADFYSTALRLKTGHIPPFGFLKMHEHINFFTDGSISALLQRHGFEVADSRVVKDEKVIGFGAAILCLARYKGLAKTI